MRNQATRLAEEAIRGLYSIVNQDIGHARAVQAADVKSAINALLALVQPAEQDPEMLQAMQESNKWHFVDDVVPILKAARAGEWAWYENTRCKYVELRIDMRDLGCIIRDREKVRISPATLAYQYSKALPATPTEEASK